MCKDFVLLAGCASFHIVRDPFLHLGPPIFLLCFPEGFILSWMSCCGVVMHEHHDPPFYFEYWWYDDFSFRGDNGRCCYEFVFGEYCDTFIVGFPLVSARWSRKCIWGCIGFSWHVEDFVVVLLEVSMPSGCSSVEVLWGFPVLEVRMVGHDGEGEFGPSQVRSPVGERFYHG